MKLSPRTITILKNFSSIYKAVAFSKGTVQRTMSDHKTLIAEANLVEDFETEFAIFDLSRFLSILSLFKEPELEFDTKYVTIKDGNKKVNYWYCEKSMIQTPSTNTIKFPAATYAQFDLNSSDLDGLLKSASILQLTEIAIIGDGENIVVKSVDSRNPTSDNFSVTVGETSSEFKIFYKVENLRLLKEDYTITVAKGISRFAAKDITYHIPHESNSSYS